MLSSPDTIEIDKSDHAMISFTYENIQIYSWNILNHMENHILNSSSIKSIEKIKKKKKKK